MAIPSGRAPARAEQAAVEVRIARQLLDQARTEGVSLVGPGGLLAGVSRTVLQADSLRSIQRQPEWRSQPAGAQLRRFLGSGARRKLRYARLLAGTVDLHRPPHPLEALLTRA